MRNLRLSSPARAALAAVSTLLIWAGPARAACPDQTADPSFNLSLECLIDAKDGSAIPNVAEQSAYRSLVSELSAGLALPVLEPADTVGFNGFHFSFDTNFTTYSKDASYWKGPSAGVRNTPMPVLPTLSMMVRKGVWMPVPPLPSVELGFGASNLTNSDLFAINGYLKLAIHEGYHRFPIPSFAVRASVSRLAGAPQLDLTMINLDGIISKAFEAGGTFTLEPYIGGGVMWSIARGQVIDTNPTLDLYRGPVGQRDFDDNARIKALNEKIIFDAQNDILRWRLFAGLHFHYSILAITAAVTFFGPGSNAGTDLTTALSAPSDVSQLQIQSSLSVGLRF